MPPVLNSVPQSTRTLFIALAAFVVALAVAGSPLRPTTVEADTTLTVTTTDDVLADDDECSLREAVIFANTGGAGAEGACGTDADGPYTIVLEDGETYELDIDNGGEDAAATGDLDIIEGVVVIIKVAGGGTATVDQLSEDRVFHVLGGSLTLTGITVTGGEESFGGGIYVFGSLVLTDSTVTGNTAFDEGGGIYNDGSTVTLTATMVTDNVAGFRGGGIHSDTFFGDEVFLAVLNIDSSTISGNTPPGPTPRSARAAAFSPRAWPR